MIVYVVEWVDTSGRERYNEVEAHTITGAEQIVKDWPECKKITYVGRK